VTGDSTLVGSTGDDTLIAGSGNDAMTGNGGNNTYEFTVADSISNYIVNNFHTDDGQSTIQNDALDRRGKRLVETGYATAKDGRISVPQRAIAALERQEIARVGEAMASARGRIFLPVKSGRIRERHPRELDPSSRRTLCHARNVERRRWSWLHPRALAAGPRQPDWPAYRWGHAQHWRHRLEPRQETGLGM
jgi:hypothetical protein